MSSNSYSSQPLFGFSIEDENKLPKGAVSPIPENNDDGVDWALGSGFFGSYFDVEGVFKTEFELIKRYREMSLHPEVDSAIEDIVNEAIVSDTYDSPIEIELSNLNASDGIKKKIREEFATILELLDFEKKSHEIYRNWYVDGRLFYHKVVDLKNPRDGILDLRYIDALKMRYIRKEKKKNPSAGMLSGNNAGIQVPSSAIFPEIQEYFEYTPNTTAQSGSSGSGGSMSNGIHETIKISKDSIAYCNSGLVDLNKKIVLSYLHKSIKSLNQLRMIEDSLVIYRLCLVGDTRVLTPSGYNYIKNLKVGDSVYTYDNTVDSLIETQVSNQWCTGLKKTYKVSSKHHSITGTETHPVLVYDKNTYDVKYVPIKDLIPKRHFLTYIKPKNKNTTTKNINSSYNNIEKIPEWVFKSSDIIKRKFIDKFLKKNGNYKDFIDGYSCELILNSKELIEDIKEIWTSIGLCSSLVKKDNNTYNWKIYLGEHSLPKFDPILCVEEANIEEVYDVEINHEKHNFVANGVVVHNSRAPERRIFYIDTGNLPRQKAEQHVQDIMRRYRNKQVYDSCLSMNTQIPLLDGRSLTLTEITKEFNNGKRLWAYSCNPVTGEFVPGLISWAGVTRKNEKVMKITLDNDKEIVCTLDHKFPVWNKGKIEAQNLKIGDSMIPFYNREEKISSGSNSKYKQIFENKTKKWKFVHRLVSDWKDDNKISNEFVFNEANNKLIKKTVHHKNYDRYNNTPENLTRMSRNDHFEYHKKHCSYAGKIGGRKTAQIKREMGLPYFINCNISKNDRIKYGKKGGLKSFHNKTGIHGISKIETIKNSKKGIKIHKYKLKNNKEYYDNYCLTLKNSWKNENRLENVKKRGKALPIEHFQKMSKLGNISRWANYENKKDFSEKQTIVYTDQIFELIQKTIDNMNTFTEMLDYLNSNIDFNEWKSVNNEKNIRYGKGTSHPLNKFSYSNLNNVCKLLGYRSWKDYKNCSTYKNHKIKNIEFLNETIDVGTLSIDKEERYHDYHTFAVDSGIYTCNSTGQIREDKKFMAMLEDFWLPRREGGSGTQVETLPGGQNLGEIKDIEYFKEKLYRSLNVPPTRMQGGDGFNLGRSSEILRDELKFTKFVGRLRKRFSDLFNNILSTQLILKNIITPDDWNKMKQHIQYDFIYDNHFSELKDNELLREKMDLATTAEPYVGIYYSRDFIRRKVLGQTDQEIIEEDKQIEKEKKEGIISEPVDPETGMPMGGPDNAINGQMGKVPIEPSKDLDNDKTTKI